MTDAFRQITIAPFAPVHLEGALRLSQQVQWPHRAEDWALSLAISKGVVALEGSAVVGTALCTCFGDVATLNMIIVDGRMQGRGLGRRLMEQVMAEAGGREMRLVATPEGRPLYEKLGFVAAGEIVQYQGVVRPLATVVESLVRAGGPGDLAAAARLDLAATGMARKGLLERIAATGDLLVTGGGFALLRRFGRGHVLGPVIARSVDEAQALMAQAARRLPGQFLRIDMPAEHVSADFLAALGLVHAGGGIAMTRAPRPRPVSEFHTYALVSQALG